MSTIQRSVDAIRGLLKRYGPSSVKKVLWDQEFSSTKWNFIDHTASDCVYAHLEKHSRRGSILDLGCGPGNTANELAEGAYQSYVGVDISEAALEKGRKRTAHTKRTAKNTFVLADFMSYAPTQKFDIILFRESMYHIPVGKIKSILDRLSANLTDGGVFVVRMAAADPGGNEKARPMTMFQIIVDGFDVIERAEYGKSRDTVMVFRPKAVQKESVPGNSSAELSSSLVRAGQ